MLSLSLCFIALSFVTIVLWFLCFSFLSLGFALHYIHAFHSRCFFYLIYKKKGKKRKEKGSTLLFLQFSLFLKIKLINLFSHDMFCCTLFSFDELIYCTLLVKALLNMLCGKDVYGVHHFVLILKSHVVWLSDLILLRNHLTTVH